MTLATDDTDRAILRALAADATVSTGTLGKQLGLSQPATWRRIRRLQEAGVIAGRKLDLDLEKLGFGVTVFLGVKLATRGRVSLDDFERAIADAVTAGQSDIAAGLEIDLARALVAAERPEDAVAALDRAVGRIIEEGSER
ncbi:hypothetical protein LCGC14_2913690 [marine sediment metagenome]|uniref:HTH asnC-type domain-containing protein n=1 Tax=marine sediment metagenome TaxID=412755 RepID=A0A0F8YCP3_9ZZZZ